MIGPRYIATGITIEHRDGAWAASANYIDGGFANDDTDARRISTEGTLHTRYLVRDGAKLDALTVIIDVLQADAKHLGITWGDKHMGGPGAALYYEGTDPSIRAMIDQQAKRLGWMSL